MADLDVYQLSTDVDYNNQACTNVLHFLQSGTDGTGDPRQDLTDMFNFVYATLYRGLMVAGVTFVQIRVRRLIATETQTLINTIGSAGTHAGDGMPTHAAALLRQRGGSDSARQGTGGQKIVGVPVTAVSAGRLTAAYAALMQTYGELGESDQGLTDWTWRQCILSTGNNARTIEQNSVSPRIVTVRSRQIGVGA